MEDSLLEAQIRKNTLFLNSYTVYNNSFCELMTNMFSFKCIMFAENLAPDIYIKFIDIYIELIRWVKFDYISLGHFVWNIRSYANKLFP